METLFSVKRYFRGSHHRPENVLGRGEGCLLFITAEFIYP